MILAILPASCFGPLSEDWNLLRSLTSKVLLLWASYCNCWWSPLFWSVCWRQGMPTYPAIICVLWLRKFCYYEPVVANVGDHPYFEVFVGMSKVCQRTQPFSCSRHKRNGCKAQAAQPTMMSGRDGCLHADLTWVGSGEKEGESFHVCFSAAQCWLGTVAEQGSAWSASTFLKGLYKRTSWPRSAATKDQVRFSTVRKVNTPREGKL